MRKDLAAFAFLLIVLTVMAAGCIGRQEERASTVKTDNVPAAAKPASAAPSKAETLGGYLQALGSAPAGEVSGVMDKLWLAGVVFMVGGGVAKIFGLKSTGGSMFGTGAMMFAIGFLLMRFPWVVLIAAGAAGVCHLVAAIDQWRTQRKLGVAEDEVEKVKETVGFIAEAVQNTTGGKQVKEALKAKGEAVSAKVDAVIDPIKNALHAEGRI